MGNYWGKFKLAFAAASEEAERTRKDFASWLLSSFWGLLFDLSTCIFSLLSVGIYIYQTYFPDLSVVSESQKNVLSSLEQIELIITFIFLSDFVIYLYAAESRLKHLIQPLIVVDFVTIMPALVIFAVKQSMNAQSSPVDKASKLNFLRFVRVLKLLRVLRLIRTTRGRPQVGTEVTRQIFTMVLTALSLIFCFAGLIQVVELTFRSPEDLADIWNHPEPGFSFHDAVYFTIITVSTVGYGDFYPTTVLGKFLTMIMILSSLATITDQINKLMELLSMASPWARATYQSAKYPHVLLCGNVTHSSIRDFLEEFFHPDHGMSDTKVVILGNQVPSASLLSLLSSANYSLRTVYLEGSALVDKDLQRADIINCLCVFILCDKFAEDPFAEDSSNIIRAISIKKYVSARRPGEDIRIILQLLRPENRHHLNVSTCGGTDVQIICMDEIKMNLLGKSCLCPGFSTLISNLMISSGQSGDECERWMTEYLSGSGKEIYCTTLSPSFGGMTFNEVCSQLYRVTGATLFAVEITDTLGYSRVILNPARYRIPPNTSPVVFLIAEDVEDADSVRTFGLEEEEDNLSEELGSAQLTTTGKYPQDDSTIVYTSQLMSRLERVYHVTSDPVSIESRTMSTLETMTGHVLICGMHNDLHHFVATLRPKHISRDLLPPIVILNPELPPPKLWNELCHFPGVYYIQGSPLETQDLVRAGLLGLSKVIILSNSNGLVNRNDLEAHSYLVDADALFVYQSITKVRPEVHIVCEIVNSKNLGFLDIDGAVPFAAGMVYVNSVLDKLAVQAYYNVNLVRILRELVVNNCDTPIYSVPNLHPSQLSFFPVPVDFEGKPYIQLFQYLVLKCMTLPLGIYRKSEKSNPVPYVITSPSADMLVHREDYVYSLQSPEMDGKTEGFLEVWVMRGKHLSPSSDGIPLAYSCEISIAPITLSTNEVEGRGTSVHWNQRMNFSLNRESRRMSLRIVQYRTRPQLVSSSTVHRQEVEYATGEVDITEHVKSQHRSSIWSEEEEEQEAEDKGKTGGEIWLPLELKGGSRSKNPPAVCVKFSYYASKIRNRSETPERPGNLPGGKEEEGTKAEDGNGAKTEQREEVEKAEREERKEERRGKKGERKEGRREEGASMENGSFEGEQRDGTFAD
ncbi:hypothetical protein GUITHDRAFT_138739 [Guillardia theta CCMP2712]|uniref:BK channel n=1 Tax=Guillardia theta (strain CCMP2712) TaxID=905079 RepID=L1JCR4_GUITC|nr:hypothetical protein GUITHDRAFT_138739 [Guillardia theta CCMP2712]EKX45914.1 hypothetical protein GUITHDRAFT_138739 [Guillardia theta CCMP2712]|eukprot:XP_005832894.1 hypothetical protein GUITHDRAFT_138739 [Guillardia theta CCMP2712]